MEHKAILVDSQYRQRGVMKDFKVMSHEPWEWKGVADCLDLMSNDSREHYQSIEITSAGVCDNASKYGVLLFFRRNKESK